ncbi:hypothetical protein RF11_07908 [Thelohanellus kitauei]|uniref:Repressor of RNA polymerase III transcription MAF1 homolog n=1 Tax=Thelohanellus kitauei TaxID=669202 RepID=A0A0C2J2B7_THEKT|nr:hypothetical protein RF11_07908 [Thelohanellus kitauei]
MKYLRIPMLGFLESEWANNSLSDKMKFSFEAFSCKMIKRDKKLWRTVPDKEVYLPLSSPTCVDNMQPIDLSNMESGFTDYYGSAGFGSTQKGRRPIIVDNSSLPISYMVLPLLFHNLKLAVSYILGDSNVGINSNNFSLEPCIQSVINFVDSYVVFRVYEYGRTFRNVIWHIFNSIIDFNRCLVFRYSPTTGHDANSLFDEFGLVFLFYDHELKRIYTMHVKPPDALSVGSNESQEVFYFDPESNISCL